MRHAIVRLLDGRLCAGYGYRAPDAGNRLPRSVVHPDGRVVSIHYYSPVRPSCA